MKPSLTPSRAQAAIAAAAAIFEVPPALITGPRGSRHVSNARQITQAALFETCDVSYAELGRLFDRDHTTVIYAVTRARMLAAADPDYAAALQLIAQEARAT